MLQTTGVSKQEEKNKFSKQNICKEMTQEEL